MTMTDVDWQLDWQEEYQKKLVTAEEAVSVVKSGDRVVFPIAAGSGEPEFLSEALAARLGALKDVEIHVGFPLADYGFFQPAWEESFKVNVLFVNQATRPIMDEKRADYSPVLYGIYPKAETEGRPGIRGTDVFMTVVSPPDKHGYCSFGSSIWSKKWYAKSAKKVVVEVNKNLIRTYGENYIHVSEIDYFVEHTPPSARNCIT